MIERSFFDPKFKHSINKDMAFHNFTALMLGKYDIVMDFDVFLPSYGVNLQRGLVWDSLKKEQFILSLLRGISPPKFVTVLHNYKPEKSGEKTTICKVIDGKQRITTIFEYMQGKFSVNFRDVDIFWDDLHPWAKTDISDPCGARWDFHYSYPEAPISDDTMIDIFELVNFLGTPQDAEHLNIIKNKKI